jgi:PAS domain S-box-containing protein
MVTVALLLVFRHQGNRTFCAIVSLGFILYAVGDLTFTVEHAQGAYTSGTPQDAVWITAYLVLAAAARHPAAIVAPRGGPAAGSFDLQGTMLVFGLLVIAAGVQWLFAGGPLTATLAVLWVALVLTVGCRQVLLVSDNQRLRTGLEQRVREQTADLRRITRQTEVLLNSVGDGLYGVDLQGKITFVNPSGAAALGSDPDALLGLQAHEELHADDPEEAGHTHSACYVRQSILHGLVVSSQEDTYVRRDGTRFPVEVTASPLVDDDRISGAVVAFRDVTQRREVERMKDEFLSIVSHELRTPLTSIRGSLGMLGSGTFLELPPQAQRMVTIAVQSSDRLTRLINDILDVERIRSGKLRMDFTEHRASELVHDAAREMNGLAEASDVRLVVGRTEGSVSADGDRIVQTLTNLVGNAIKFSPPGGVVTVTAVEEGSHVTFAVADEGRGIPTDKLESVFEPFEQVDSSDSRDKGGTGIGLTISRGIVERHGGQIWAESQGGAGTVVSFRLPRIDGGSEPVAVAGEGERTAR